MGEREPKGARRFAAAFRCGPAPTRDVKTRTPRSVGTCDRLQRPHRLHRPRSARSAAGCRPLAPARVWGARAEAEPGRSQSAPSTPSPPANESERGGREGRAGPPGGPAPCPARLLDPRARPGRGLRARSADPRGNLRRRHHVSRRCGGRRWPRLSRGARERRRGGAGGTEGASQFLGTPSEAQTFPQAGTRPPRKGE